MAPPNLPSGTCWGVSDPPRCRGRPPRRASPWWVPARGRRQQRSPRSVPWWTNLHLWWDELAEFFHGFWWFFHGLWWFLMVYIYIYIYVYMYVCMYVCVCVYVCVYVCMYVCLPTSTYGKTQPSNVRVAANMLTSPPKLMVESRQKVQSPNQYPNVYGFMIMKQYETPNH